MHFTGKQRLKTILANKRPYSNNDYCFKNDEPEIINSKYRLTTEEFIAEMYNTDSADGMFINGMCIIYIENTE
jgi:hypothetical protein